MRIFPLRKLGNLDFSAEESRKAGILPLRKLGNQED